MKKYDLAIIGAGLAGLTTAYVARKAGMSVIVLDKARAGSGASGGLVGALAPHMPEHWNDKKQYQHEAMLGLPDFWREIDAHSGLSSGYQKLGRMQNIADERGLEKALMRAEAAKETWKNWGGWKVNQEDQHPFASAPFGYVRDDVSAQIMPREAMKSLAYAALKIGVEILDDFMVEDISSGQIWGVTKPKDSLVQKDAINCAFDKKVRDRDDREGKLGEAVNLELGARRGSAALTPSQTMRRGDSKTIKAQNIVIAAGHASWPWAREYLGADFGEGTKGQAAMLRPKEAWNYPMVTGDGFYIVPHSPFELAVGSTSERYWKHMEIDGALVDLLDKVMSACPALVGAEIIETWAGIRPRAFRPDPLIGQLEPGIFINSGGFKTGFSFATKLAQDLVGMILGEAVSVPNNFLPAPLRA